MPSQHKHIIVINLCDKNAKYISLRISENELTEIDQNWRSDPNIKNRSEYIRQKLGLRKNSENAKVSV